MKCLHRETTFEKMKTQGKNEEDVSQCECVSHRVFGICDREQVLCRKCGAVSEPVTSTLFTAYTYAYALRTAAKQNPGASFCKLLHIAAEDKRPCPNQVQVLSQPGLILRL